MMTFVQFQTPMGRWAVPIERVHEVRLARGIAPLPVPRRGVAGVIRQGDDVITVVSLLGDAAGHVIVLEGGGELFGLLAGTAIGILRTEEADIAPPPAGQEGPVVTGVVREDGGGMVMLVDVDEVARALA
jgi:chemotaxis signal transduction protein